MSASLHAAAAPPAARRPLALCLWLALLLLCGCGHQVTLQASLNEADANEIVALLTREGIESFKSNTKDGVQLAVGADDLARAIGATRQAGLPRRSLSNLGAIFKKEGMISTPMEERIRYIHGLSDELEDTLQQFDHVISARVHVVLPERVAPGEPLLSSSAAVFVKYHRPIDADMVVPRIRHLVASSIPGLGGEDGGSKVSVVLEPSDAPAAGQAWSQVGPFQVAAASAGALSATLLGLGAALGVALLACGVLWLKHHPAGVALRRGYATPAPFGAEPPQP